MALPCGHLRVTDGYDFVTSRNGAWTSRSVEGEMVLGWGHLASRSTSSHQTFTDINRQLRTYELEGFDMRRVQVVPDNYCLGWASTPKALEYSCRWLHELTTLSMRTQFSFQHAQPDGLRVAWFSMLDVEQSRGCALGNDMD